MNNEKNIVKLVTIKQTFVKKTASLQCGTIPSYENIQFKEMHNKLNDIETQHTANLSGPRFPSFRAIFLVLLKLVNHFPEKIYVVGFCPHLLTSPSCFQTTSKWRCF